MTSQFTELYIKFQQKDSTLSESEQEEDVGTTTYTWNFTKNEVKVSGEKVHEVLWDEELRRVRSIVPDTAGDVDRCDEQDFDWDK